MKTSVFDLFKIGIGPSSSHTVGPMRAAKAFVSDLTEQGLLGRVDEITVELYGSLALTGKGHGTDRAILLGLEGEAPDEIEPSTIDQRIATIRQCGALDLGNQCPIVFDESRHLIFRREEVLPKHSNGMRFTAFGSGRFVLSREYYSIGGGFLLAEGEESPLHSNGCKVRFPFSSAATLLRIAQENGLAIWQVVLENEKCWHSENEVRAGVFRIWKEMQNCTQRGLMTPGILPGGLNVTRRAPELFQKVLRRPQNDPLTVMDWVNLYAIAVNEENAAGSRVVTAPTNGAAGVIPAVGHYYRNFVLEASDEGIFRYFLTASAIGALYKENASISGAEVGCQGEVGVACSMASAGLVAALEGTNAQIEHAAEIGMEHNLGMTCDPVGGLVQIPCIERNAFGAVKAVNAARMAMTGEGGHKVTLDQVIDTMYRTGLDMHQRYKETSLGGLALSLVEC